MFNALDAVPAGATLVLVSNPRAIASAASKAIKRRCCKAIDAHRPTGFIDDGRTRRVVSWPQVYRIHHANLPKAGGAADLCVF
jgi:hypothetical protein